MTIQTDPTRCWVRIDHTDGPRGRRYLIGNSWRREPFGEAGLADEFSLTIAVHMAGQAPTSAGIRLDREDAIALRAALDQYLW